MRTPFYLIATLIFLLACNPNSKVKTESKSNKKGNTTTNTISVTIKNDQQKFLPDDTIFFNYTYNIGVPADSIILYKDNIKNTFKDNHQLFWTNKNSKVGKQDISFTFYWGDSLQLFAKQKVTIYSDIVPEKYTYKVITTFKHNTSSYTQGLEFDKGILYEGTGQYGESMLMKYNLDKNELLQSINLPNEVFGEGITIMGDKIFQITWKSNLGFVYDKSTFNKLYDINYPTDGWGLTNDGNNLFMSDGTENVYIMDKEYFTESNRIQVYDNEGPINYINEMEYINGLIYANIYQTNNIIVFEPQTGRVLKIINMTGLLKKEDITTHVDVLNGIAWDKQNNRIIVTGKLWPKLYQVEFIKQN